MNRVASTFVPTAEAFPKNVQGVGAPSAPVVAAHTPVLVEHSGQPRFAARHIALIVGISKPTGCSHKQRLLRNISRWKEFGERLHLQRKRKMRTYLAMAAVAAMITGTAMAQPANRDANTPAVNTPNTPPNPGAPVAGSNSFTEGQAKSRIESNGFSNVSELRKDDQGVWRGKAMKDGKSVTVSLDFQGNVTAQ
jgi:hypothetical protein